MLYRRLVEQGTLSEPDGVPDPQFALPGTINWMRALALLIDEQAFAFPRCLEFYRATPRHDLAPQQQNTLFQQLVFALHHLSAVEAIRSVRPRADVDRVGIVAWYYGVFCAAGAMLVAQEGLLPETHAGTANRWDNQLAARDFVMPPFSLRASTLVEKAADAEIKLLRRGNEHALQKEARTPEDALGACCAYLSGSVEWYRWRLEEDLKQQKDFKALGVTDFRSKRARELRDSRLGRRSVSFLHQAYRYRGKANYREALFLGYGRATETLLARYIDDLARVLTAFVQMAGAFCHNRLGTTLWSEFIEDVENERAFSLSPSRIWPTS